MQTPDDKLDLDSISFDDMLGEGLASLPDIEEKEEDIKETPKEKVESLEEEEVEQTEVEEKEVEEVKASDEEPEEAPDEELEVNKSVASEIAKTLGFELENEYEDSVEGLTQFARDIGQEIAEDQLKVLFSKHPDVQKHMDYVLAGGDSEKYFEAHNPKMDYDRFTLQENDVTSQQTILAQYFQLKGHDKDFIQEMIEDYGESGKLFGKATAAKDALAQAQASHRESLIENQKQEQARLQQENAKFWDGVANIIETGKEFAGISIPDRQKSKFFEYISAPVGQNGETQRDIDYSEAELEVKLAIDYLVFNGFKLDDIINTKARSKSATNLRDRIQSTDEKVKSARQASKRTKEFDPDNLDMTALF
jgi:hypothetical protein